MRVVAAVAAVALLAGCGGGSSPAPSASPSVPEGPLEAAVLVLNDARRELLLQTGRILRGARRLDYGDDLANRGEREALAKIRPDVAAVAKAAGLALVPLARAVTGLDTALNGLEAASSDDRLTAEQRAAVLEVVDAGRDELEASGELSRLASGLWPLYRKLDSAQSLWLSRARAGWYRNKPESAQAYAVMLNPTERNTLDRGQRQLENVDQRRVAFGRETGNAIDAARILLGEPATPAPAPSGTLPG